MTVIVIKSKKKSPLINAIADFAKEMDLEVETLTSNKQAELVLKRKIKPVKSFSGILKNPNPPDLKEIRKKILRQK